MTLQEFRALLAEVHMKPSDILSVAMCKRNCREVRKRTSMKPEDWIRIAEEFESPFTEGGERKETTTAGLCWCAEKLGFSRMEAGDTVHKYTGKVGYLYPTWIFKGRHLSNYRFFGNPHTPEHDIARAMIAREIAAKLEKEQAL